MRKLLVFLGCVTIFFAGCNLITTDKNKDDYAAADIVRGGQLYDNWPKLVENQPAGTHPAYPETSKKRGLSTWRCKECHGWDYVGKNGRYSKGSHFTGIDGVLQARDLNSEQLVATLTDIDGAHDFSAYLSHDDILALVKFIREGAVNTADYVAADGTVTANAEAGRPLYENQCVGCHGDDGNVIDFKGKKEGVQGIGWLANDNPQETLHKILWGHPGSDMPSAVADYSSNLRKAADILGYARSL